MSEPSEIPLDVREPAPGVRRFTVPLPFPSPDHLHVHVIETADGPLLIDTGCAKGSETALQAGLEALGVTPARVLITHAHLDHWGLATTLTDTVLAHPGCESTFDYMRGQPDGSDALADAARSAFDSAFSGMEKLYAGVPEIEPVNDGDMVGDWQALWTPGHDPGHICLFRAADGVLLCGDVLLPGYTPNVQPTRDGSDALADFLGSLERLSELPVTLVLPSHGEPYADAAGRARELMAHHQGRLEHLRTAMAAGTSSLRDLRNATFRMENAGKGDKMLAAMETYAHLEHMRRKGEVQMSDDGAWSLAA